MEKIEQVSVEDLHEFRDHTFQVRDDDALMDSIREQGILTPLLVFRNEDGEPELISGHRRLQAAKKLGMDMVPVIMKRVNRSEATVLMGLTNFMNRDRILPSERAYTYTAMAKALKSERKNEDAPTRVLLAERLGESEMQIARFLRLTELVPVLLELVDAGILGVRPAVELSYLSADTQTVIYEFYREHGIKPTLALAKELRALEEKKELTVEEIHRLLAGQNAPKQPDDYKLVFRSPELYAILGNCHSALERENRIIRGLKLLEKQEQEWDSAYEEEQLRKCDMARRRMEEDETYDSQSGETWKEVSEEPTL